LGRAGQFLGVGFEFAGVVIACVIGGYYLDDYLGTSPLFILLLTLGGMTGALYRLLWMLRRLERREGGDGS
jgi:F0F1-type ATP synthase assembly protein I